MARRKRFNSEKAAHSFAKKVNGKVNDLRQIKEAKSPFTVTYQPSEKTRKHGQKGRILVIQTGTGSSFTVILC